MALSADEKISAAVQKLRGFILYNEVPDGTSYDSPGDGFFPPVQSPSIRIYCGEILRALKDGKPLPPGVDGAELQAAVYAVKHNPVGFDRPHVGAALAFAWQAYVACSLTSRTSRQAELLAMVKRVTELLAERLAPAGEGGAAGSSASSGRDAADLEGAAAALAGLVAGRGTERLPAGLDANELRQFCAELGSRAYGPDEIDRLCRVFEKYVTALETAPEG
jgi:hypothetical protein